MICSNFITARKYTVLKRPCEILSNIVYYKGVAHYSIVQWLHCVVFYYNMLVSIRESQAYHNLTLCR